MSVPFLNPDHLRDYFQTEEQWETYARQYEEWIRRYENYVDSPAIVKTKKPKYRCKGCGQYMRLHDGHISVLNGYWHLKEKCLIKAFKILNENTLFSFKKNKD